MGNITLESYIPKPKPDDLTIESSTPELLILSDGTVIDRIASSVSVGGMLNGSVAGLSIRDKDAPSWVYGEDGIGRNHPSYRRWQVRHNVREVERMLGWKTEADHG